MILIRDTDFVLVLLSL